MLALPIYMEAILTYGEKQGFSIKPQATADTIMQVRVHLMVHFFCYLDFKSLFFSFFLFTDILLIFFLLIKKLKHWKIKEIQTTDEIQANENLFLCKCLCVYLTGVLEYKHDLKEKH